VLALELLAPTLALPETAVALRQLWSLGQAAGRRPETVGRSRATAARRPEAARPAEQMSAELELRVRFRIRRG
jgi:hypothetical protein